MTRDDREFIEHLRGLEPPTPAPLPPIAPEAIFTERVANARTARSDPPPAPPVEPPPAPPPENPWERQPGESVEAYRRFLAYRDMGALGADGLPGMRSIRQLAERFGLAPSSVYAVSSRFDWDARVRAWDARAKGSAAPKSNDMTARMDRIALSGVAAFEAMIANGENPFKSARELSNFMAQAIQFKKSMCARAVGSDGAGSSEYTQDQIDAHAERRRAIRFCIKAMPLDRLRAFKDFVLQYGEYANDGSPVCAELHYSASSSSNSSSNRLPST